MGKFLTVFAAALEQSDEDFIQSTDVVEFQDEVWVYYCRPQSRPPKPGWRDLAAGTLRVAFDPPPLHHAPLDWPPRVTRDEATGTLAYVAEMFGVEPGNTLFHLALPPGYLPIADSWDIEPLYGHADRGRFVLGWGGWEAIWPTFRFEPAGDETFAPRARALDDAIEHRSRARRRSVLDPWRANAPPQAANADAVALLDRLRRLNGDEVQTLVFELGIDYDELAGDTKSGKLRELLRFLDRQNQLPRLQQHLRLHYAGIMAD